MLATILTAMYLVLRVSEQMGMRLVHSEPLPYMAAPPTPWQIHCVSDSRRSSRDEEPSTGGGRRKSSNLSSTHVNNAASTIQTQYRKYQQRRNRARV